MSNNVHSYNPSLQGRQAVEITALGSDQKMFGDADFGGRRG